MLELANKPITRACPIRKT